MQIPLLILTFFPLAPSAPADAWPAFRGVGNGISNASNLPVDWSEDKGVAWTAEIDGYGQSSPVVWGGRVFVTSVIGDSKEKSAVTCYDLNDGRQLWKKEFASPRPERINGYISVAAPTPAVDKERIYAFFETGLLAAFDHNGKIYWQRVLTDDYGPFLGNHGLGSSIALTDDAVVALVAHDGPSYLLAVDKQSGKTLWKSNRPQSVAWSSPIVDAQSNPAQVIVSANGTCEAVDAATGEQLWIVDGLEGNTVPSATLAGKRVLVGSSDLNSNLAIRRGGRGNVSDSHIAWRSGDATATFSSPLVYGGHVYLVNRAGVAFCLNQNTGETLWTHRIGASCWASPLGAEGRVYFFDKNGETTVVAAGAKLKVVAENSLPTQSRVYGVAAVDGTFVIRTGSQVTKIAASETTNNATKKNKKSRMNNETNRDNSADSEQHFPSLPKAITSFGAARLGDKLFVHGGHFGTPHHYSMAGQSSKLLRIDLDSPDSGWKSIASGPKLQGHALVAHGGKLYRVGGFSARNKEEEDQDLWSVDDFARFDPTDGEWESLPPMPVPRSSFDAIVSDNTLYVAGGWAMRGASEEANWHDSAYAIDLSKEPLEWRELAKQPFKRRAVSLAALDGKIYVIGGMQPNGKTTTATAIFDPAKNKWLEGPPLPGEGMEGFGTAACTLGRTLYVSTISGKLLRLADDGQSWKPERDLHDARFFHRMVPIDDSRLIMLGGANMETGKFSRVEIVKTSGD